MALWGALLVTVLCTAVTRAQICDCKSRLFCPAVVHQLRVTSCSINGVSSGVCCPMATPITFSNIGFATRSNVRGRYRRPSVFGGGTNFQAFRPFSFPTSVGTSWGSTAVSVNRPQNFGGAHVSHLGSNSRVSPYGSGSRFTIPGSASGFPTSSGSTHPSGGLRVPSAPTSFGQCLPLVLCPDVVASPQALRRRGCQLPDGSAGVTCSSAGALLAKCPPGLSSLTGMRPFTGTISGDDFVPGQLRGLALTGGGDALLGLRSTIDRGGGDALPGLRSAMDRAASVGRKAVETLNRISTNLLNSGQIPNINSPTGLFFLNAQSTQAQQSLGQQALQSLITSTNLPSDQAQQAVLSSGGTSGQNRPQSTGQSQTIVPSCNGEQSIQCDVSSRFRTITGQCNNLKRPRLGRALTGFKRLSPNTFDDNLFAFRTRAVRGGVLPSARRVSQHVLNTLSLELNDFTLSLMQFSQFVDHDLTHALVFRLNSGSGIECCQNGGQTLPSTPLHPQCIPIPILANDPFYSRFGQRCMSLVRSLPAPEPDCVSRPAKPLNELTMFLDMSNIYGSQEEELRSLRANRDGLLVVSAGNLLPVTGDENSDRPCRTSLCYRSGDTRANEQSGLAVMHTIFHREHNRIACVLKKTHPGFDDERLFEETRRVLIAQWQHIVYNEWLPIVIGKDFALQHALLPLQCGHSRLYSPDIDPTISNAFATAAFRFGHTMVRDVYDLFNAHGQVVKRVNVSTTFFDPTAVANNFVEHARTLVASRSESFDTNFAPAIHEMLFTTNFVFGLDLLALNVQRGRDHGTPTYAQVAEACGAATIRNWGDLNRVMDSDVINRLRFVYDDPRDVDLFIGGVCERLAPGAQVGPTFRCVIAQQFFDMRYGDRFFYDNGNQPHSFSERQLTEIRKSSWARIMCDTLGPEFGNDFGRVQPLAFISTIGRNQVTHCHTQAIPSVDLSLF